jgi:hypothetical protein
VIKGVVFDFDRGLVQEGTSTLVRGVARLIAALHERGIIVGGISGRYANQVTGRAAASGLGLDQLVTRDVPNATKGSGRLIQRFCADAGLKACEVAAVVTDEFGFREAINAPVLSFRAGWSGFAGKYSLRLDTPEELLEYLDLFFRKRHLWFTSYDGSDALGRDVRIRALIDASGHGAIKSATIAALKEKRDSVSKGVSFSKVLVMHLIASLYLEGFLCEGRDKADCIIYPGHSTISQPAPLIAAALVGLQFVRMNFPENGLVRWSDAVHSSRSRMDGKWEQVRFANQPSTIYVPAGYKIAGKRIFALDDFTTDGFSLEAARNVLLAAGAASVTSLAFGKYPKAQTIAIPKPANVLEAHKQRAYSDASFAFSTVRMPVDEKAMAEFAALVGALESSTIGPKLLS